MPNFGKTSTTNLEECDLRLQDIAKKVINILDFSVIEGHRGKEEQDDLFDQRKTKVRYPNSKHNSEPSKAFDWAPYPIDWRSEKELQEAIQKYTQSQINIALAERDMVSFSSMRIMKQKSDEAYNEIIDIVHNIQRWYLYAGAFKGAGEALGISVRSGADWDGDGFTNDQTFDDIGHLELRD